MSETKWTSGIWYAVEHIDNIYSIQNRQGGGGELIGSLPQDVRRDGIDFKPTDRASANAHLIAAAPELYEALREAVRIAQGVASGTWDDLLPHAALLAKARGEA